MNRARLVVLLSRLAWLVAPIALVPSLGAALDSSPSAAKVAIGVAAWGAWAAGLVSHLVASTASLTALRLGTPLAVPVSVGAAIGAETVGWAAIAAVGIGVVATATILSADVGQVHVQGSAYGDETRLPLRAPVPYLLPILTGWLVPAALTVGGGVTLAHGMWIIGVVLIVLAGLAWWLAASRFHRLSRRWLVFVPAGVVVHDQFVLAETVMFRSSAVRSITLAPADSQAADLTGGTSGRRIDVALEAMETIVFHPTPKQPKGRAIHAQLVQVAPSRPGVALTEARRRGHA